MFVIILVYIQISDLIETTVTEETRKVKFFSSSIFALIVVFVHDMAMEIASYNVDLLAIPLCIEMLRICINRDNTAHEYYAFLAGMALALKLTNIVYIIPLLLVYVVKNRKRINGIDWIKCVTVGSAPVSIYAIYSFVCTGNPMFPYMNSIFKSRFFYPYVFRDVRWGPTDVKETFLWIFYHIIFPNYRQSEIPNLYSFSLLIGLIAFLVCTLISIERIIKKKRIDLPIEIYIVFILSSVLWSFTTGYSRYFILGDILLIIIFFVTIVRVVNIKLIRCSFTIIVSVMLLFSCMEIKDIFKGREWSSRRLEQESVVAQMKYVLKDKPEVFEYQDEIDAFFLTESYYGGFAFLSNRNAPIFNVSYYGYLEAENLYLYEESFNSIMKEENIYDIKLGYFNNWETYEDDLKKYGLEIADKNVVNNGGINIVYIKLEKS